MRNFCLVKRFFLVALLTGFVLSGCSRDEKAATENFGTRALTPDELAAAQRLQFFPMASDFSFSPNGKWLAVLGGRAYRAAGNEPKQVDLILVDFAKRAVASRAVVFKGAGQNIRWSQDGNRVAACGHAAQVWRVAHNGTLTEITKFSDANIPAKTGKTIAIALAPGKNLGARIVLEDQFQKKPSQKPVHFEVLDPKNKRVQKRLTTIRDYPSSEENVWMWPTTKPRALFRHSSYNGNSEIGSEKFSMWDLKAGKRLWEYPTRGLKLRAMAGRGGRDVILTGITGSRGRELYPLHETQQLDAKTGRSIRKLPTQSSVMLAAVRGNRCLTYGVTTIKKRTSFTLKMLDLGSGKTLWEKPSPVIGTQAHMDFSPDEKWAVFVTSSDSISIVSLPEVRQGKPSYREMSLVNQDENEDE
jgi:hypothetical protein